MNKKILCILMLLFLAAACFYIIKKINKKDSIVNLSGLVLKDLNGQLINFNDFNGKPLIINYWASWCGPCREEFPYFEKMFIKYGKQINFIMVSAEPKDKILQFKKANNYSLPFAQSQKQFNQLGITSIPLTVIYSAQTNLLTTKNIPLTETQLLDIILGLIKK